MPFEHIVIIRGAAGAGGKRRRPLDGIRRQDLFARWKRAAKSTQWHFYDLATRLQTKTVSNTYNYAGRDINDQTLPVLNVNDSTNILEYVELNLDAKGKFTDVKGAINVPDGEIDVYAFTANHTQIEPDNWEDLDGWDNAILGIGNALDPLAFSKFPAHPGGTAGINGDGTTDKPRNIPNCLPVWYGFADQPGEEKAEIIRLTVDNTVSGGYFLIKISIGGKIGTSPKIAYNAPAYKVKQALETMSWAKDPDSVGPVVNYKPIDSGDIASVTGTLAGGMYIHFGGRLWGLDLPNFTIDTGDPTTLIGGTATVSVIRDGTEASLTVTEYPGAYYTESANYSNDLFDLEISKGATTDVYPNATYREIVADVVKWWRNSASDPDFIQAVWAAMQKALNGAWTGEDPRQVGETWNPLNATQHGQDLTQQGVMQMTGSGTVNVRLKSRLAYEPFDTADTSNFKVTKSASYNAAAVVPKIDYASETHVYLKPQLMAYCRQIVFDRRETINYTSYRFADTPGDTIYNHQTSASIYISGGSPCEIVPSMNLGLGQDPDSGPFTFTANITMNQQTGAFTVTGLPAGTISGTMTFDAGFNEWEYEYYGANFRLYLNTANYPGTGPITVSGSLSSSPYYSNFGMTISVPCQLWRGAHIGRYPAFPRNIAVDGWLAQTRNYESYSTIYPDGTEKTATFVDSVQMNGRECRLNFGSATTARQVYSRRSNRDTNDYVYYRPYLSWDVIDDTGQDPLKIVPTTVVTWKKLIDAGDPTNALADEAAAVAADVKAQLLALAHVAAITSSSVSTTYREPTFFKTYILLPVDGKAGSLCGVISQKDIKYYIWRKTDENRGGYDHERNQGRIFYSGNIT